MPYTVTNDTTRPIIAPLVEGKTYRVDPEDSLSVPARTALLLAEYGLTLSGADRDAAIREESDPIEATETRYTGTTEGTETRQHRMDDPRANVAGTPLEETGDTGSTTDATEPTGKSATPDVPKVPAIRNARAAVTKGAPAVNDPDTQPTVVSFATQADIAAPAATDDPAPGSMAAAAAQATSKAPSTGAMRAVARGAANAPQTGSQAAVSAEAPTGTAPAGSTDAEWVGTLDRAALNAEMEKRGLSTLSKSTPEKRTELAAFVEQYGRDGHL